MSTAKGLCLPFSTSGDMYIHVPTISLISDASLLAVPSPKSTICSSNNNNKSSSCVSNSTEQSQQSAIAVVVAVVTVAAAAAVCEHTQGQQ
jgi:histidine ammonia-lyase